MDRGVGLPLMVTRFESMSGNPSDSGFSSVECARLHRDVIGAMDRDGQETVGDTGCCVVCLGDGCGLLEGLGEILGPSGGDTPCPEG